MANSSQGRQKLNSTNQSQRQRTVERNNYIQGNAVKKLDVVTAIEEKEVKKLSPKVRQNREKAVHMSFGYVLFLSTALLVAGFILISYIKLQAEITSSIKSIAILESQLNDLQMSNDEEYSRITSSIDLDEVKRVAIEELGMQYPTEDQVIVYNSEESDYVRQVSDISE
jgi:hypothetical protein